MPDEKTFTLEQAHNHFARALNGRTWTLLDKSDRTAAETEEMIHAAHASCCHWLQVGTGLNHQRGEWLIARVYTVVGHAGPALRHATRCLELTEQYAELMQDFDWAYAYEGIARASALAGNRDDASKYRKLAEKSGAVIADAEDKKIFVNDLNGGEWFGVK